MFVMLWSARLAGFLLFRVLKTGSDNRFDEMRSHFFRFAGFWAGQILWVWVVCKSSLRSISQSEPASDKRSQAITKGCILAARAGMELTEVALPTVILNSPAVSDLSRGGANPSFGTGRDIAGIILFVIGFFWESVSDIQKVSPRTGQQNIDICLYVVWHRESGMMLTGVVPL